MGMDESIEDQVVFRQLEEGISQSVSELHSEYQNVIKTKWIDGKTNKEIAKEFKSTENAIKQRLYRARKALKGKMSKWGFNDEKR
nr:sigma-70 family RNA polymerase sigma factor [Gracilibacillus ureilyticus]